jgi:hypothetical protein
MKDNYGSFQLQLENSGTKIFHFKKEHLPKAEEISIQKAITVAYKAPFKQFLQIFVGANGDCALRIAPE